MSSAVPWKQCKHLLTEASINCTKPASTNIASYFSSTAPLATRLKNVGDLHTQKTALGKFEYFLFFIFYHHFKYATPPCDYLHTHNKKEAWEEF
jgi:hypothetical protein